MSKADDYNASELAAGRITPAHVTVLTRRFQAAYPDLTADGMCGPATRAKIEEVAKLDTLTVAASQALANADAMWRQDIYDPATSDKSADADRCRGAIDGMIQKGLLWTWEPPYAGDGSFEWCGAFLASAWIAVKASLRQTYYASTYRLDRYARYLPVNDKPNPKPATGPYRMIVDLDESSTSASLTFGVQTGDILLIGPKPGYGAHICFVEGFDAATSMFLTVEGNGTGLGPNGERQQGVVRARRSLGGAKGSWCARRLIRIAPSDLA
jgi:hypothetical protein